MQRHVVLWLITQTARCGHHKTWRCVDFYPEVCQFTALTAGAPQRHGADDLTDRSVRFQCIGTTRIRTTTPRDSLTNRSFVGNDRKIYNCAANAEQQDGRSSRAVPEKQLRKAEKVPLAPLTTTTHCNSLSTLKLSGHSAPHTLTVPVCAATCPLSG